MSVTAECVGAYLRTLRLGIDLKMEEVAHVLGTSYTQIARIETGKQDTNVKQLIDFAELVRGRAEDVLALFHTTNGGANVTAARALAHQRLVEFYADKSDDELVATLSAVRAMKRGEGRVRS